MHNPLEDEPPNIHHRVMEVVHLSDSQRIFHYSPRSSSLEPKLEQPSLTQTIANAAYDMGDTPRDVLRRIEKTTQNGGCVILAGSLLFSEDNITPDLFVEGAPLYEFQRMFQQLAQQNGYAMNKVNTVNNLLQELEEPNVLGGVIVQRDDDQRSVHAVGIIPSNSPAVGFWVTDRDRDLRKDPLCSPQPVNMPEDGTIILPAVHSRPLDYLPDLAKDPECMYVIKPPEIDQDSVDYFYQAQKG
jgi:hypothetical protein